MKTVGQSKEAPNEWGTPTLVLTTTLPLRITFYHNETRAVVKAKGRITVEGGPVRMGNAHAGSKSKRQDSPRRPRTNGERPRWC